VLALPKRLGFEFKKLLGSLIIVKFDKDGAFEELLVGTAETNGVGRTVWSEERLNIELGGWFFVAKALDIDTARICLGSGDRGVERDLALN